MAGTFITLGADGNTKGVEVYGRCHLSLTNDFGSGTAKLQAQAPDGSWVDVANGAFTAATDTVFDFPRYGINTVRVNLASSTSPDLDIWIQGEGRQ
jgi:hypothetical protein